MRRSCSVEEMEGAKRYYLSLEDFNMANIIEREIKMKKKEEEQKKINRINSVKEFNSAFAKTQKEIEKDQILAKWEREEKRFDKFVKIKETQIKYKHQQEREHFNRKNNTTIIHTKVQLIKYNQLKKIKELLIQQKRYVEAEKAKFDLEKILADKNLAKNQKKICETKEKYFKILNKQEQELKGFYAEVKQQKALLMQLKENDLEKLSKRYKNTVIRNDIIYMQEEFEAKHGMRSTKVPKKKLSFEEMQCVLLDKNSEMNDIFKEKKILRSNSTTSTKRRKKSINSSDWGMKTTVLPKSNKIYDEFFCN